MEHHTAEDVNAEENVNVSGGAKVWISQSKMGQMPPLVIEGDRVQG